MNKLLGKKGLLILLGVVLLLAGLIVQVGIAYSIRAEMNAGADRMDLRAFYETLHNSRRFLCCSRGARIGSRRAYSSARAVT